MNGIKIDTTHKETQTDSAEKVRSAEVSEVAPPLFLKKNDAEFKKGYLLHKSGSTKHFSVFPPPVQYDFGHFRLCKNF